MTPHPLELYRVSGTHHEVGIQMGELGAEQIRRGIEAFDEQLPKGRTRDAQLKLAREYRDVTVPTLPWLIDELDGCAEGAGVDTVDDEPVILQVGGVPWISVGWNQAGLSLTGNELSPNDERVGISRSHQVFEMLRARNLHEMVAMAIRPDRASSYNNVLADRYGDVANVEGSATDVEITRLDDDDHLAHTNHYVTDRMRDYEGDRDDAVRSDVRYCRARELLAAQSP